MVGSLLAWNSLLTYWGDLSMSRDILGRPDGNASFDSRIALLRRTFRQLLHLNVEKKGSQSFAHCIGTLDAEWALLLWRLHWEYGKRTQQDELDLYGLLRCIIGHYD